MADRVRRRARARQRVLAVVLAACALAACQSRPASSPARSPAAGGTLRASVRAEPRSFNVYATRDLSSQVVAFLTHAALVRVDRVSQQLQPELAEAWELLPDAVTWRLSLRHGLSFSDGEPFTSADVVFSFNAIYQGSGPLGLADSLRIDGRPLVVAAEDPHTVTVRFPGAFGPGLRAIEGVPILPRHLLEGSLAAGTFAAAWGLSTNPAELAGLGPFVLQRYDPGQRLLFERNHRYWRRDAAGTALPSADQVVLEIVPDQDTELLRVEAGQLDFTQSEIRPMDYAPLKNAQSQGRLTLTELGVGLDGDLFWTNLNPSKRTDPRAAWLQHAAFRRAVSQAVDRDLFVNTVYLGAAVPAYGVVSPGNRQWYADVQPPQHDPASARAALQSLNLRTAAGAATLVDAAGRPVRFTLLTQKGNTSLERGAAVIRDSLKELGVQADVVALDVLALVERFTTGDYDAVYFRLISSSTDPALNSDFWFSSGSAHVWNLSQPSPATEWERDIDRLMGQISTSGDEERRRTLFADVQRIMARELPAVCFAFPRLWVAMSTRVAHATPAASRPPILWNPAVIALRADAR